MNYGKLDRLDEEIDVWYGIVEPNQAAALDLRRLLSEEELARADRYRFPGLQQQFVQRRGIMRMILGNYLGLLPDELEFTQNRFGKPSLTGNLQAGGLTFSLTHSGFHMALAVGRNRALGVDLELHRDNVDHVGLSQSFFAQADVDAIQRPELPAAQLLRFYEIWTSKEAYIKAIGAGLSIPLDQFSINLDSTPASLAFACHDQVSVESETNQAEVFSGRNWHFKRLNLAPNTSSWLAFQGNTATVKTLSLDNMS